MKNKKKRKVLLLVLLLLAVSIGFAALSTTLKIIGTTNISKNTWNIYWENKSVNQNGVSTTAPTLSAASGETANTIATWSVSLGKPGDFYEFTINAVNAGTIDAMIAANGITNTVVANNANTPEQLPSYISYTVTYEDGTGLAPYHLLSKAVVSGNTSTPTKEAYKVRVEFTDNITPAQMNAVPEGGYSYTFTTQVTYVQADEHAIPSHPTPLWSLPQGKTADTLALGDEICLSEDSTQCFNFVRYEEHEDYDNVIMLAKYNLNVGEYAKGTATNMQDSDVKGDIEEETSYGYVQFAPAPYWLDGNGELLSKYRGGYTIYDNEDGYPADAYDSAVQTVATDGSDNKTVAYYVEEYKSILQTTYGATIQSARLLTLNEAVNNIGCTLDSYDSSGVCPATGSGSFIKNTTFWLGTVRSEYSGAYNFAYYINYYDSGSNYQLYNQLITNSAPPGVRPVIVVVKSEL